MFAEPSLRNIGSIFFEDKTSLEHILLHLNLVVAFICDIDQLIQPFVGGFICDILA